MLSGSAIARVLLLILVAALGAVLVQYHWQTSAPPPEPPTVEAPTPVQPVAPAPSRSTLQAPAAPPPDAPAPTRADPEPRPVPGAPEPPIPAAPPSPETGSPAQAEDEIAAAEANAGPRAVDGVDLNTASVEALNRLKGGGAIGRAIVQHRPYATVDQLLTKRVLSRAVFQRIKDQVTVR